VNYVPVFRYRGVDICVLEEANPLEDKMGYIIDDIYFEGKYFNTVQSATDAIDENWHHLWF